MFVILYGIADTTTATRTGGTVSPMPVIENSNHEEEIIPVSSSLFLFLSSFSCSWPLCSCSCPFPLCSWFRPLFPYLFLFVFAFVLILFAFSRPLISKTNAKTQKRVYHTEQTRYWWLLLWSTQCTRANCGSPLSKIRDNLEADGSHTNSKIQNDMHQIWNWQIG